jgi:hypothetical protein
MHMVLTGESMKADEAEQAGLVAKIVPPEKTLEVAIAAGAAMASMSRPVLLMAKESVSRGVWHRYTTAIPVPVLNSDSSRGLGSFRGASIRAPTLPRLILNCK